MTPDAPLLDALNEEATPRPDPVETARTSLEVALQEADDRIVCLRARRAAINLEIRGLVEEQTTIRRVLASFTPRTRSRS